MNVIVDEVLLDEKDWLGWQEVLEGLDVLWVQVTCDLAVVEARERGRADRMLGLARSQHDIVHRFPAYAAHADTGAPGPEAVAGRGVQRRHSLKAST